jgi:hypothetical protein
VLFDAGGGDRHEHRDFEARAVFSFGSAAFAFFI